MTMTAVRGGEHLGLTSSAQSSVHEQRSVCQIDVLCMQERWRDPHQRAGDEAGSTYYGHASHVDPTDRQCPRLSCSQQRLHLS